jgi:2-polyprenyl-3-methyl-5-hydroxy-6-metoxy-1,4-benzoquinol methylase
MAGDLRASLAAHPALNRLVDIQLEAWPEAEGFLGRRFAGVELDGPARAAELVLKLADDPRVLAEDYRWLCLRVLEEELQFRRSGKYRHSRFEDVEREVYSNAEFMRRYMNGLLMTQVWWDNHTRVIDSFVRDHLPALPQGYAHVEIGSGHGLLLSLAAKDPRCGRAVGWDFSQASVDATRGALERLGVTAALERRNIVDGPRPTERFDSVVLSEILEHLEDPIPALAGVRRLLAPQGRVFINVPTNSPASDHLYLLRTPEEAVELVRSAGFSVELTRFFALTGFTEAQARTSNRTISCVIVATASTAD